MPIDRDSLFGSSPNLVRADSADGGLLRTRETDGFVSSSDSSSSSSSSPMSAAQGAKYIEHRVSKMDTLAGVAIKYGVEVADIKRMNGLVTDIQMFAHKSIQIPLPGKHPPSPITTNGSSYNGNHASRQLPSKDGVEPFQLPKFKPLQQRVSPAMKSLQGYYGLTPPKSGPQAEGMEMAVYRNGRTLFLEDESLSRALSISDHLNCHQHPRSLINGFSAENGNSAGNTISEGTENAKSNGSSVKSASRRQNVDIVSTPVPELLLEDSAGAFSGRTGKSLAPRPKSGNRADSGSSHTSTCTQGDSSVVDALVAVRKSSSTSNLQESSSSSSIWPTSKWSLKPDVIARPFFDGLPKPMAARRNKAALD